MTPEQSLDTGRGQTFSATRRDTLLELAERCEKASGADRELDAAIWWRIADGETSPELMAAFEANAAAEWDRISGPSWRESDRIVLRYTASLDAAMTLVPEDHSADLTLWGPLWDGKHRARLLPLVKEGDRYLYRGCDPHFCVNATTPALALASACLKARAAMAPQP